MLVFAADNFHVKKRKEKKKKKKQKIVKIKLS